jgi:hypothetical protein
VSDGNITIEKFILIFGWKAGRFVFLGGGLLLNTCLASLPTFGMGIFLM